MYFLTSFFASKSDSIINLTNASPQEDNNWIIEHVSDHKLIDIPPVHIGGFTVDFSITTNILMIVGVLFGSVGGFINLLRAVNTKKPAGKKDGK